jgi:PncC family amidohydrolase
MSDPRASTLHDVASRHGIGVALAESATGGLVAARITAIPGVSTWFRGSAVVYATSAKERILRLDRSGLAEHGPVSAWAAGMLAIGARERFGAELGLSITGVAGPGPDERDIPAGMVYIGWSTADEGEVNAFAIDASGPDGRARVRTQAADIVLETAIATIRAIAKRRSR